MVDFYLDLENGSDGANGLSFANRKKTFASCASAMAASDFLRVMASPAPTDTGQSGTWTAGGSLTLTTAVTTNISLCASAWTGSTGVTCSTDTTNMKEGSQCVSHAIGGTYAFGSTPIVAYFNTGTLDLSARKQVSFWIRSSVLQSASTLALRLSTTTNGTTSTHQFTINVPLAAGRWTVVTYDNGAALNSAILSVALIALSAPAVGTILMDNIVACNDSTAVDSITLNSLVGINEGWTSGEAWWHIRSLNGTTVVFDSTTNSLNANIVGYTNSTHTTRSATVWKRDLINAYAVNTTSTTATLDTFEKAGTSGNPTIVEGGYNRTDMSNKTGFDGTWIDGRNGNGRVVMGISSAHTTVKNFGFVRVGANGIMQGSITDGATVDGLHFNGVTTSTSSGQHALFGAGRSSSRMQIGMTTPIYSIGCVTGVGADSFADIDTMYSYSQGGNSGVSFPGSSTAVQVSAEKLYSNNCRVTSSSGSVAIGWNDCVDKLDIKELIALACGSFPALLITGGAQATIRKFTCTGASYAFLSERRSELLVYEADMTAASGIYTTTSPFSVPIVSIDEVAPTTYEAITRSARGNIILQTATTYSGTKAWQSSPTSVNTVDANPLRFLFAKALVLAGQTLTFKCRVRRSSLSITARIKIMGGSGNGYFGITSDQVATASAAANTWEELTLTAAPTETGVLEIWAETFGGTTLSAFFDGPISKTVA